MESKTTADQVMVRISIPDININNTPKRTGHKEIYISVSLTTITDARRWLHACGGETDLHEACKQTLSPLIAEITTKRRWPTISIRTDQYMVTTEPRNPIANRQETQYLPITSLR